MASRNWIFYKGGAVLSTKPILIVRACGLLWLISPFLLTTVSEGAIAAQTHYWAEGSPFKPADRAVCGRLRLPSRRKSCRSICGLPDSAFSCSSLVHTCSRKSTSRNECRRHHAKARCNAGFARKCSRFIIGICSFACLW